ncbi:MAG: nucleoside recognition protein [Clostridia bacterium]|nr:nucleoside recognition protein [Clostridia bacterium]
MMNAVWAVMILMGLLSGIITGQGDMLLDSMIAGCGEAVTLCVSLLGAYMMWMGIMEVARDMGVINVLARKIRPVMGKLFPNADDEAIAPITLNMAANFFGMGSAATPFGIEAMKEMQKTNSKKHIATNSMCMFIAVNAAAPELLPTSVLALRTAAGSQAPYSIVLPTAICSVVVFVCAVLSCKLLEKVM